MNISEKIADLIRPTVEAAGYELWGCEYVPQGQYSLLRVYIDTANGIVIDDCEKVSREVSAILDVEDPIKSNYSLEVSSPGLERPLYTIDQYQRYIGVLIKLRLGLAIDGHRKLTGKLLRVENEAVVVLLEEQELRVPLNNIEKANLLMGQ